MQSLASVELQSGFNKYDRNLKRPEETMPAGHKDIISTCQAIYRKVGMIRNIIDLMADFASEGLELRHPVKSQQRFFQSWAKRVDLNNRAHDWLKLFLRDANVVVRRKNAIVNKSVKDEMTKADIDIVELTSIEEVIPQEKPHKLKKSPKVKKGEIPWKYTFISPTVVEKIGGEIGKFYSDDRIGFVISTQLKRAITKRNKTNIEQDLVKKLPAEVVRSANNSKQRSDIVALDPDKTYIDYYKKDDWEDWGTPFLFGVLEDIILKEKMKLADAAALDGVINVTRIWKLGDHKEKIMPNPIAVNKLLSILQHNVGGGIKNIVWDSMIEVQTDYPPIDQILGDEKYSAVNRDIMKGVGIPEALVGGVDLATRNAETAFVQLKTLIERLEYARQRCIRWIQGELALVAKAMGFKRIPMVAFGTMSLRDEAAEKQLIIQLVDRGIISIEAVHEVFGKEFVIELQRLRDEQKIREKDPNILEKSNPYNRPITQMQLQHDFQVELQKVRLGGGDGGDNPNGDQPKDSGDNQSGRPPNVPETDVRDKRTEKVLSVYKVKGEEFLLKIDKIIDPLYLKFVKAKNMRALTKSQTQELEKTKFAILATLEPDDIITQELIREKSISKYSKLTKIFDKILQDSILCHAKTFGQPPKLDERRSLATFVWATLKGNFDK